MARILHVEDYPPTRYARQRALAEAGHEVVSVATVAEARDAIALDGFELALVDVVLPDGHGAEFCSELRQHVGPLFPIILITARARGDVERMEGISAGASLYLTEPVAAESLRHHVHQLLSAAAT